MDALFRTDRHGADISRSMTIKPVSLDMLASTFAVAEQRGGAT